jgi:hypothetical protein
MSTFKLKDIATGGYRWPSPYVNCRRMKPDGTTYGDFLTIPRAQFNAHNANFAALERETNRRREIAETLQAAAEALREHKAATARKAARARIAAAEAKLEARREAKRRAGNRLYNAVLKQLQTQWRAPTVGQATVQHVAPVAAPAPVVPQLTEVASLAEAERQARVAVEQTRPRYEAIMYADNAVIETSRGFVLDRKSSLKL